MLIQIPATPDWINYCTSQPTLLKVQSSTKSSRQQII